MKKRNYLFLVLIALIIASCSTVPLTERKQLLLVSDQEVLALGLQSFNEYIETAVSSSDAINQAMVKRCGEKIQKAVEEYLASQGQTAQISGYDWEFVLTRDSAVNAFCMPGGKVVVYDGILPYTKTENGLAVVIGHEIAHAVAKHSNERISQQMLAEAGSQTLSILLSGKSETTQLLASTVFGLGANYGVMLPFSRKQEYEADKLGLIFMTMAGYDASEAVTFWERMSSSGTTVPEFLSTHPSDANRIAAIKALLPELEQYKK
ncbi:MAG: M48 family metallopeptidase [Bacteroidales bacterium]|nr:M48 family metallopeptidase [Bacteroidales bacterium]